MRHRYLFLAFLLMLAGAESATAQKVIFKMVGSEPIKYDISKMEYIMFEEATPDEHEWVDLGLPSGTLWATCNLGAETPEDVGYYFAWGETTPKDNYTWGTYKWMTEGTDDWSFINKYTFADNQTSACWYSGGMFVGDNKQELDAEDDAATAIWGSGWQLPSVEQIYELINNSYTKSEWTMQKGVYGRKVTSLSNGNSIFLPAAGWRSGTSTVNSGSTGYYWSNSLGGLSSDYAFPLYFLENYWGIEYHDRFFGHPIRPVHERQAKLVTSIELNYTSLIMELNDTESLIATVYPSDANDQNLTWESSNPSVVAIDYVEDFNCGIIAMAEGSCKVICRAMDGSGVYAECNVTVNSDIAPDDHEWVDLGLPSGTYWATTNVGANSPEEYGDYFAWGETTPKEGYTWGNYLWMTEGKADWNWISKYTFADNQTIACWYSGSTFIGDGKKELEPDDDAATKNWGSDWRMPSKEQFDELIDPRYTKSEWGSMREIQGLKIKSLRNGNTLFLPATGYFGETGTSGTNKTGNYWARMLGISDQAFELFFKQDNYYCYAHNRKDGQSVRPVRTEGGTPLKLVESIELNYTSLTMNVDEVESLTATVYPSDADNQTVIWESSNPSVVAIDYSNGLYCAVVAKAKGTCKITCRAMDGSGVKAECNVTSTGIKLVKYIRLNYSSLAMEPNMTKQLTATVLPSDADNQTMAWESSNTAVATVSTNGLVTAKAEGSCKITCRATDGSGVEDECNVTVSVVDISGSIGGKDYVDLGLPSGTLWATCNVGASSPEDYGDYFAWGETQPKADYEWSTYKYCKGYSDFLTKYCIDSEDGYNGFTDGLTELVPGDDAATANWGNNWQMPNLEQCQELINSNYTTSIWTVVNGVRGRKITSKQNGKSIFFPAAGYMWSADSPTFDGFCCEYWSRSLYKSLNGWAYHLRFEDNKVEMDYGGREQGRPVRPVRKK